MTEDVKGDGTPLKCDHPRCGVTELLTELRATRERLAEVEAERDEYKGRLEIVLTQFGDFKAARDAAIKRLPKGMENCTIVFIECPLGHGRLTATNWIDNGCGSCKLDAAIKRAQEAVKELRVYKTLAGGSIIAVSDMLDRDEYLSRLTGEKIDAEKRAETYERERDALQSRVEELENLLAAKEQRR